MKKILSYISSGTGTGKRYLLGLALLFAVLLSFFQYYYMKKIAEAPEVQAFLSEMPEIEIKDGKLLQPADMHQVIPFTENGKEVFSLTIDTRIDRMPENIEMKDGFYLTKEAFYYVTPQSITMDLLQKVTDVHVKKGDYQTFYKSVIMRGAIVFIPFVAFACFVFLYIFSLIFAAFSYIPTYFMEKLSVSYNIRRRASVVSMAIGYAAFIPLSLLHIFVGGGGFFVFVFLFLTFFMYKISKSDIKGVDKLNVI